MSDNVVPQVNSKTHQVSIDTVISLLDHEREKMEEEKFRTFKMRATAQDVSAEEALGLMAEMRAISAVFHRIKMRLTQAKATEQRAVEEKSDG